MTTDEQHLDGNVVGGLLRQIFAFEMTTAEITCAGCGKDGVFAETTVFASPMGTIVRCPHCSDTLIRVAQGPHGYWIDWSGTRLLRLHDAS